MRLVVDASVVIQVAIAGNDLGPLRGHDLLAPPLIRSEILSTVSEMAFRSEIPAEAARAVVMRAGSLNIALDRPDGLDAQAWDLARSLGWAKTYDAEYLALGVIRGVPLLTLDERLRRGAGHIVPMPLPSELTP